MPPYKPWRAPWGQEVLVPLGFEVDSHLDGSVLIYPCGDRSALPSGRMAPGSYFFDAITRQEPIDEDAMDYHNNLEEFQPVSPAELERLNRESKRLSAIDMGAIAGLPGTALGDVALVSGPGLRYPRGIRDVTEWYVSTLTRKNYIHRIFEAQTALALENLPKLHEALGCGVDAVFVCGTDFGTQTSQFCSPATFESLYLPYYKQINDWIHNNTSWKTFKHSCGAVVPLIPKFIDAGFDILNPVQCSAAGMDPEFLKCEFGHDIVFWGGCVDTQRTLPFGKPAEVRAEVLHRCELFGRDGGYVFNAIHNVQADTPVENISAMVEAVREFNGY